MTAPPAPDAYRARLAARRARVKRLSAWDTAIAWGRLALFIAAGVATWLVFKSETLAAGWLAVPGLGFIALVALHDRVIRALRRAHTAAQLYDDGLARIEDRWPEGDGRSQRFSDENHLYAADLDLFGKGGLYERLSVARTAMGEETLAAWLSGPAPADVVRARQQGVGELGPRLDLREDLALLGSDIRAEVNPTTLAAWGQAPAAPLPAGMPFGLVGARVLAALVAAALTGSLVAWLADRTGALPFVGALLLAVGFVFRLRAVVEPVLVNVDRRAGELKILALLLGRLEREQFDAPLLVGLRASLDTTAGHRRSLPPSRRIARLARLVGLLEARRNQMVGILVAPLLWTTQLALAVESWRRAFGPAVGRWLATVGQVEALASLGTYAYEHPELPFPSLADDGGGPLFDGEALAHPLLPVRTRVPNDVVLGAGAGAGTGARLLLVSGSNMSGKSTLLRTLGVNAALALAGGPVCARRLTLSRLAIGATLSIHDSLREGRSRFYAEITRLRQIVDLGAGPVPVLFLIDEMLSGTNSHDRRIGAEGVLRALLGRNAIGLATTHDLALAEIADALAPAAANVHFEDEIRDGQITFDYRMRPGVVRKSNALALMRAVGLDV